MAGGDRYEDGESDSSRNEDELGYRAFQLKRAFIGYEFKTNNPRLFKEELKSGGYTVVPGRNGFNIKNDDSENTEGRFYYHDSHPDVIVIEAYCESGLEGYLQGLSGEDIEDDDEIRELVDEIRGREERF
ncbi:MAG: hypothetical protein ABIF88_03120 [archaeon]